MTPLHPEFHNIFSHITPRYLFSSHDHDIYFEDYGGATGTHHYFAVGPGTRNIISIAAVKESDDALPKPCGVGFREIPAQLHDLIRSYARITT